MIDSAEPRRLTVSRAAAVALVILMVAACGQFVAPSSTPGSMDYVIANLVLRGATVHRLVSGDAGCPTSELHDNAISLEVALFNQSALHQVYLLRWRRPADFDAAAAAFADCVAEYQALHPGATVSTLESAPWRAYGPTWNEMLRSILDEALRATGGS